MPGHGKWVVRLGVSTNLPSVKKKLRFQLGGSSGVLGNIFTDVALFFLIDYFHLVLD